MKLSTGALATASARHPWRTIGAWIAVMVLAVVAIVTLLGGSLTTEGEPTNNPEAFQARDVLDQAFPPDPGTTVTDIVVVRSDEHTVDSPQFESFVRGLVGGSDTDVARAGADLLRRAEPRARLRGPARDHHPDRRSSTRTRPRRWSKPSSGPTRTPLSRSQ